MFARLTAIALAALLLTTSAFTFSVSQRVMDAVRPITSEGRNICTATKINDPKDLWLTANHCIPPADYTGEMVKINDVTVIVVSRDAVKDLAVVFVPGGLGKALRLQSYEPTVGQTVKMWGHPVGVPVPQLFAGHISSLNLPMPVMDDEGKVAYMEYYMMMDMSVCGGNSGSAILNENDEILSVMQIGIGTRPCMVFSGGARYHDLKRFAEKYFGPVL